MNELAAGGRDFCKGHLRDETFWSLLILICAIATGLRIPGIDRSTFWLDEIYTVHAVSLPVRELIEERLAQAHSPLFFLLLKALQVPIDSFFWVRLPSALFGMLAVLIGGLAGRAVLDARAGLFAASMFATMPTLISYAQEARSYTGLVLGIVLALGGAARIVRHPRLAAAALRRAPLPSGRARGGALRLRLAWGALLIGCIWSVYMLVLGLFFWLSICLSFLFLIVYEKRVFSRLLIPLILGEIVFLIFVVPVILAIYSPIRSLSGAYFIASPNIQQSFEAIASAFLFQFYDDRGIFWAQWLAMPGKISAYRHAVIVVLLLFVAMAGVFGLTRKTRALVTVVSAFVAPLIILAVLSLDTPLWITRYLLVSTPAFCLLLGAGFSVLARRSAGRFVIGVVVLLLVPQVREFQEQDRRNWGALISAVSMLPDHAILVPSWIQQADIRHEWRRLGHAGEPPVVAGPEYVAPNFHSDLPPLQRTEPEDLRAGTTYVLVWYAPQSRAALEGRRSCLFSRQGGYAEVFPPAGGSSPLCAGR